MIALKSRIQNIDDYNSIEKNQFKPSVQLFDIRQVL